MKVLFLLGLMSFFLSYNYGLRLINYSGDEHQINFTPEMFEKTTLIEESDDFGSKMIWKGYPVLKLITGYNTNNFNRIIFTSSDNYQVSLSLENIEKYDPIIALSLNGKELNPDNRRLIAIGMRKMYWISDIETITLSFLHDHTEPYKIYIAYQLLKKEPLIALKEIPDWSKGYKVSSIMEKIHPIIDGEVFLLSFDGLTHILDYKEYIEQSSLVFNHKGFHLINTEIPRGMWLKNIAYIQFEDIGIIFTGEKMSLAKNNVIEEKLGLKLNDYQIYNIFGENITKSENMKNERALNEVYYLEK